MVTSLQLHASSRILTIGREMWRFHSGVDGRWWSPGLRHCTDRWEGTCVRRNKPSLSSWQKQLSKNLQTTVHCNAAYPIRWFVTLHGEVMQDVPINKKFQQNLQQHWRIFLHLCTSYKIQSRLKRVSFIHNHSRTAIYTSPIIVEYSKMRQTYRCAPGIALTNTDLDSWIKRDQLDVTCFIISLFTAQHVSDVNTSILRSLRLIWWVNAWLWFDVCWCYVVVWLGWCGIRMQCFSLHTDTTP